MMSCSSLYEFTTVDEPLNQLCHGVQFSMTGKNHVKNKLAASVQLRTVQRLFSNF